MNSTDQAGQLSELSLCPALCSRLCSTPRTSLNWAHTALRVLIPNIPRQQRWYKQTAQSSTVQHSPAHTCLHCRYSVILLQVLLPLCQPGLVCNYNWAAPDVLWAVSCELCGVVITHLLWSGINSGHLSSNAPIWSIRDHHYVAMSVTLATIFHVKLS